MLYDVIKILNSKAMNLGSFFQSGYITITPIDLSINGSKF